MSVLAHRFAVALAITSELCGPAAAAAQLRPLDPVEWRAFDPGAGAIGGVGGGLLAGQRASIGGLRGRLLEAPAMILAWAASTPSPDRQARVVLRAIVHPLRVLSVDSVVSTPLAGTTELDGRSARDAGDNALETLVRLTSDGPGHTGRILALRYGVRLPTHNDRRGLDRHRTDFYGSVAGGSSMGGWRLSGEAGLGVFGTRQAAAPHALPFLYSIAARRRFGVLEPSVSVVGQASRNGQRGNEDLSELRAGVRAGRSGWVEATFVRGLARHSPAAGLLVFIGYDVRRRPEPVTTTPGGARP